MKLLSATYSGDVMEGTKLDISDFKVVAKYDDGTKKTVEEATLAQDYVLVYGQMTSAKITYEEKSTTVAVVCNVRKPTVGEGNALKAADSYLSMMPFSHDGSIKQLEYENYSTADATYATERYIEK